MQAFEKLLSEIIIEHRASIKQLTKQMKALEKKVLVERTRELRDQFALVKRTRSKLETEVRQLEAKIVATPAHAIWLSKLELGETLQQLYVSQVWTAFYFFSELVPEPESISPVSFGAHQFTRPITAIGIRPYQLIQICREANCMPMIGSGAMQYLLNIQSYLRDYANGNEDEDTSAKPS